MIRASAISGLVAIVAAACTPKAIVVPTTEQYSTLDLEKETKREKGLCHPSAKSLFAASLMRIPGALASIDTFCAINTGNLIEQLGLIEGGEVTIIYPGAGVHLSPLQLAHALHYYAANRAARPFSINFIYTEQQLNAPQILRDQMKELKDHGFHFVAETEKPVSHGQELLLEFAIELPNGSLRPFTVTYALNTAEPEKGDHPYFRQEYARAANIIITHDIDQENEPALFEHYLDAAAEAPHQQLIVFEDYLRMCDGSLAPYSLLPGDISVSARGYGCAHKTPDKSSYTCAIFYFPDHQVLEEMTPAERYDVVRETFHSLFDAPKLFLVPSSQ